MIAKTSSAENWPSSKGSLRGLIEANASTIQANGRVASSSFFRDIQQLPTVAANWPLKSALNVNAGQSSRARIRFAVSGCCR